MYDTRGRQVVTTIQSVRTSERLRECETAVFASASTVLRKTIRLVLIIAIYDRQGLMHITVKHCYSHVWLTQGIWCVSGQQLPAVNTWVKLGEIILLICTMATVLSLVHWPLGKTKKINFVSISTRTMATSWSTGCTCTCPRAPHPRTDPALGSPSSQPWVKQIRHLFLRIWQEKAPALFKLRVTVRS